MMSIHAIITKRFDVASISGLTSGTPMSRRPPMRMLVVVTAALLVAVLPRALAQGAGHHEHKRTERAQIIALEHEWQQATLADDASTMDKLLSEDYLGITASGEVLTKTQQLDRMRDHKLMITRLETSDRKIKLIGNIAIVTSLAQVEGSDNDEPLNGAFRYTRIYQRISGALWKVTSFEITPATRLHPTAGSQP